MFYIENQFGGRCLRPRLDDDGTHQLQKSGYAWKIIKFIQFLLYLVVQRPHSCGSGARS
jgi:hypothetical protein